MFQSALFMLGLVAMYFSSAFVSASLATARRPYLRTAKLGMAINFIMMIAVLNSCGSSNTEMIRDANFQTAVDFRDMAVACLYRGEFDIGLAYVDSAILCMHASNFPSFKFEESLKRIESRLHEDAANKCYWYATHAFSEENLSGGLGAVREYKKHAIAALLNDWPGKVDGLRKSASIVYDNLPKEQQHAFREIYDQIMNE